MRRALQDLISRVNGASQITRCLGALQAQITAATAESAARAQDLELRLDRAIAELAARSPAAEANVESQTQSEQKQQFRAVEQEIATCRRLAASMVFILGFARSGTTILTEIVNTASRALILGEANFYMPHEQPRFRDRYNTQHFSFRNQVSKSTYAPDFLPISNHLWWEWLEEASTFYSILGDKMAFNAQHFDTVGPAAIMSFFEARFFASHFLFTMRSPVPTLLSIARLFNLKDNMSLRSEIIAWLRFVILWADWIRTFPNTLTVIADDLDAADICRVGAFAGLDLSAASVLLDDREKRLHGLPEHFAELAALAPRLDAIFGCVRQALEADPVLFQADQKRNVYENDTLGDPPGTIAVVPQPVGQAWVLARGLLDEVSNLTRTSPPEAA